MRVLILCHKPPWPTVDGGTFATARMAEGLASRGHEVEVLALATAKHPRCGVGPEGLRFDTVDVDTRPRVMAALVNLGQLEPYQLQRFFSKRAAELVTRRLREREPDVVQLDGVGVLPYLSLVRESSNAAVIYRAHNVEHQVIRNRATASPSPFVWWLRVQAGRLKRAEMAACREVDGVVAISEPVAAFCRQWSSGPVEVIGVGLPIEEKVPEHGSSTDLVHLGAMDWPPNREGVQWFVREVWPALRLRHPDLKIHLGGRHSMNLRTILDSPGVVVDGEVASAADYLTSHGLMVVPLLSGSGIRVKIVEGMALGKAIIASPVAVEGLGVEAGRHLLVAEDPVRWVEAIDRCLEDPELVSSLRAEARRFADRSFSLSILSKNLENFYTVLKNQT